MIQVARNVVEQIAEYGKKLSATPEIAAGKKLPGYRTYEKAIQSQFELGPAGAGEVSGPGLPAQVK
jgi:hypothetical protein